jgi:hypothetical protein
MMGAQLAQQGIIQPIAVRCFAELYHLVTIASISAGIFD